MESVGVIEICLGKMESRNDRLIRNVTLFGSIISLSLLLIILILTYEGARSGFDGVYIYLTCFFTVLFGVGAFLLYYLKALNICSHQCDRVRIHIHTKNYEKANEALENIDCTNKLNIQEMKELLPSFSNSGEENDQ